jgi:ribosome recycling factor
MNEMISMIIDEAKEKMDKALTHLDSELLKIRAGKATPSMLDSVKVDYYGTATALAQVANISVMDARTLTVQPWEKNMLDEIAKGITNSNLGLNPQNNGEMIIISVPMLTEERRRDLVKKAKSESENAKVGIRNARKDANTQIKKLKEDGVSEDEMKDAEAKVQTITNQYVVESDARIDKKEKDIMTI